MSGINSDQQIDLLFKQFNVVANTEQAPTSFANQPFLFRDNILNQQILAQEVPSTLPSGFSISELDICGNIAIDSSLNLSVIGYPQLTFYKKLELQQAGNNSAWWHIDGAGKNLLQDTIPFKFDESSADSYNSQLFYELSPGSYAAIGRDEAGTKYLMDTKTGIIEFYEDPATLNTIINASFPPRLSFIAYTGTKGITGGGGGGGDISFNDLSVNNLDVSNNLYVGNNLDVSNNLIVENTISSLDNILLNKLTGNSVALTGNKLALTFNEMSTFNPGFLPDHISLNGDFKVTIKTITGTLGIPTTVVLKFNAFYSCQIINGVETHKSRGINIISYTTNTDLSPSPPAVNQARLLDGIELGSISNASSLLVMINLDFNSNFFAGTTLDFIEVEFTNNGANGIDNAQFDYWAPNTNFAIGNSNLLDTYTVDLKEVNSITNFTADKINLDGTIKLNGPVEINGKVTGNIDVRTDIDISGNINFITGDISGVNNIYFSTDTASTIQGVKDVYINNNLFVGTDISCAGQVKTNGNNLLYKTSATNWNSEGSSGSGYVKYLANIFFNTSDDLTLCVDGTFRLYAETKLNNELFTHELIFNSGLNSSSSNTYTQDPSGINQALYIDLISSKCNSSFPLFKWLFLKSRLTTPVQPGENQISYTLFTNINKDVYGNTLDYVELQVYNNNTNLPVPTANIYNRQWNITTDLSSKQIFVGDPIISTLPGDLEKYKYISFMPDISGDSLLVPYPTFSLGGLNYDTLKYGNNAFVDSYNMKSYEITASSGWYTIAQLGPDFNYQLKQLGDGLFYIDTSYWNILGNSKIQSLIFRTGIINNGTPYINVISNTFNFGTQAFNQIRILYNSDNINGSSGCLFGGAVLQIYSTNNSSSSTKNYVNIKCYQNKGNSGWNINDISYNNWNDGPASTPICYVDVSGYVDVPSTFTSAQVPKVGSVYNNVLYSPLLNNRSNSTNQDIIYYNAGVDISGGNLTVSDGNLNVENGNIDFSNSHIILNNTDISTNNLTIQSDNSIVLDVSNSIFTFSENKLDMSRNELYNIDIINANIQDISGSLIIKTNDNNINASNSTNITLNNIVKLPVVETFDDLSGAFHNFDSDPSNNNNNIIVYNKEIDLLSYRVNQQRNSDFIDPSSNLTDPFLYSNPCIVHLECYLEGWQGGGGGGGVAHSGVLPDNNVSNNRRFMPFTTGVTQRGAIGSGISGEFYGYPLINNAFNFIDVPEYGFRTDVDCMVTGMSFQTLKIDSTFNPPSFPGYTNSLFQIVRTTPSHDSNPLPSEIVLGVEVTDPSFTNISPATKYKIGTILYGPTTTSGVVNTGTGTAPGEVYFFTNESFVRVPANKRIHPFVGYIKTRTAPSTGFDLITMRGSVSGIFFNSNTPINNNTGYARVKLYIHNYFGQKKEINIEL